MALTKLGIGTSANDGTGDALRTAFDTINDNYDEFFSTTGDSIIAKYVNNGGTSVSDEAAVTTAVGMTPAEAGAGCMFAIRYEGPTQYYMVLAISDGGSHWYMFTNLNTVIK